MKIMTPMGCLAGLCVIFTQCLVGGVLPMWSKNIKMALGFNFRFQFLH